MLWIVYLKSFGVRHFGNLNEMKYSLALTLVYYQRNLLETNSLELSDWTIGDNIVQ